jgi:serine/threonine protein kinase
VNAPAELTALLGKAPLEDFVFVRALGEGGMGTVSLLRHQESQEHIAIKLMRPELMGNIEIGKRFLREMQNSAALDHPNIVRVRDAVHAGSSAFFTMEYCEGGSVEGVMEKRGGPLGVQESLDIILPCLDGLEYAHQAEVPHVELADGNTAAGRCLVHRDLKPANLLLGGTRESPVPKIGDFGLAKVRTLAGLSGVTRTASGAWGTPAFMSRRQAVNFKYSGPEVDVWSMTATLYYMLTGEVPRDFSGPEDGFVVVRDSEPIPILERKPDLPKKLAAVIDEALVETGKARYPSASALKDALKTI